MAARKSRTKKGATRKVAGKKAAGKKSIAKKAAARKSAPKRPAKPAARKKKQAHGVPEGYHAVTAYLCIDGAADAIDFYKRVFGAEERMRMDAPGGRIGHAELVIGDCAIMLADEAPELNFRGPRKGEGTSINMHVYVPDVDGIVANAVAEGAELLREIEDKFYGDRSGTIMDPFGHVWHLATRKEDLTPEEMARRAQQAGQQGEAEEED